jgi:DNA-binding HxlR family transcriptional regulator
MEPVERQIERTGEQASGSTMDTMQPTEPMARASEPSPLEDALARVGDRWSLLLVGALQQGARRFNDLLEEVPGIAPNILAERLKRLERGAVLIGRPYSDRPPRKAYELTGAGRELAGALRLLALWGARGSDAVEPLRHTACGTPLEARWYCPTCAEPLGDEPDADIRYV